MSNFKSNLESLPSVNHLASLEVIEPGSGETVLMIENKPGKAGSLAVYQYLFHEYGGVTKEAVRRGLELFAEYTDEAKQKPGSHPNIDFLLSIIDHGKEFQIRLGEK